MMIEPPGEFFRRRVLEINNGILITVEHISVEEQIAGTMQQTAVRNIGVRVNPFEVKTREGGCRGHAVKAVPVIKDAKFHGVTEKLAILAIVLSIKPAAV